MNFFEFLKDRVSYMYSFMGGVGLFFLKFLSLSVLINLTDFDNYPQVLLASGLFIFAFSRLNKFFSHSNILNLFYLAGASTYLYFGPEVLFDYFDDWSFYLCAAGTFAFFISLTQYSELILKDVTFNTNKSIKNSKLINKLIFFEETGLLLAATVMLLTKDVLNLNAFISTGLIPLALILLIAPFVAKSEKETKSNTQDASSSDNVMNSISKHSFVLYAVLLVSSVFLIKQLYSYGAYVGFKQLESSGKDFTTVFSILNIAQTCLIFVVLGIKIFLQKSNVSWNSGVKLFLNVQFFIFSALILVASPLLLVSASAFRKVLTHTVLNESFKLLHINYPNKVKNEIQHMANSYSSVISYLVVAGFAFAISKEVIGVEYIWGFAFAVTGAAVYFRKKLFGALVEYQISNLLQKNVYEAVNSCYCLAHKEASLYAPTLGSLLSKNPRPMLTKAIIYTLGEMQHPTSIDLLITRYGETEREDIQLCIIQAIMKYNSHKVDLFLLECLEQMVLNQVSLGEIRRTIFTSITSKIDSIAIPMSLRLLKNNSENQRIIANIMLILGELSIIRKDKSLFELLLQYTDYKYSRRIRSNAFMYLYTHKDYQQHAMSGISEYIVSGHEHDRSAAAFLAGELGLKGMYHYVKQLSLETDCKNSTIEISLLKLNDNDAPKSVAAIIFSDDANSSLTCLNQLNSIEKDQLRYKVYNYILDHYQDKLGIFMKLLSDTKRNFDEDRRKIYEAANSRNITIDDRNFLFSSEVEDIVEKESNSELKAA